MPLVSVVIPTFGRPELVCRAVAGVLAQTVAKLEVIVVIDGDDPATRSALAALKDDRLRVISHDGKRGAGQARDTGADAARGEWVAFLDDDDEWLPGKLAAQLAAAPAEPAILMTLSRVVSAAGVFVRPAEIYDNRMPVDEWLFDRRTWTKGGESFLQTSSLMMPKALFALARFTDTKQHEEWELVIRAVKQHGYRLVTADEPLVVYYVPETRKSLSRTYTWQQSIIWAVGMRAVMTRRAFSGFCLTVVAQMAATNGKRAAFGPLLWNAFRYGAPTAKQLFAFAFFFLSPQDIRHRLRAWMQAELK
jgi:glycosyltransferase involved in cell wall biosynthesis